MKLAERPTRFGEHRNAFGFLRLLFASLVIVSHVPEVVDRSADRELLHRLVGTTTLGGFAVSGFFVVSGYLITGSLSRNASWRSFLAKRIARIYPGFIAASVVCLVLVVPLSGGAFEHGPLRAVASGAAHMAILARPMAEHPFAGQRFDDRASGLNGAMWTIQYEFFCYLLVLALSALGVLRHRWMVPSIAALLLGVATFGADLLPPWLSDPRLFSDKPDRLFFLSGLFLAGAGYYLYRDRVAFTRRGALIATLAFVASLFGWPTMAFGYALFGSYLILAAAQAGAGTWVGRINDRTDISYGVYLYAWPVEQLLIRYTGTGSLVRLGVLTWIAAMMLGWLSWKLVEEPVLRWTAARRPAPAGGVVSAPGAAGVGGGYEDLASRR